MASRGRAGTSRRRAKYLARSATDASATSPFGKARSRTGFARSLCFARTAGVTMSRSRSPSGDNPRVDAELAAVVLGDPSIDERNPLGEAKLDEAIQGPLEGLRPQARPTQAELPG